MIQSALTCQHGPSPGATPSASRTGRTGWSGKFAQSRHTRRLTSDARALVREVAGDEDALFGGGLTSASAYETAWVALLRAPGNPQKLAFPSSLAWLLRNQARDGHWGALFPHTVLPTMASLLALRSAPRQKRAVRAATRHAEAYLASVLPEFSLDRADTPLIEFLIPTLLARLAELGTTLPVPDLDTMAERAAHKLSRLPLDLIYDGRSPLIHGLEALGDRVDLARVRARQMADGSYGYSPSSTAAILTRAWDERAAAWLERLASRDFGGGRGGMPASYPSDTFEAAWVMYYLGGCAPPADESATGQVLDWLRASLTESGASFGRWHAMPADADDTAMIMTVLSRFGQSVSLDALWRFECDDHFVSYPGERTASTTTNAHVLEAIMAAPARDEPAMVARRDRLVAYLVAQREVEGCWLDKWSVSPFYATSTCALALCQALDAERWGELAPTLRWAIESQHGDGGWGVMGTTAEETAYALLILSALSPVAPTDLRATLRRAIRRGRRALRRRLRSLTAIDRLPPLWIDKTLYAPARIIRAVALAALSVTQVTQGKRS